MTETDHKLNKALRRVCEERLFPNLVSSMSDQLCSNSKLDYRRMILNKYKDQLRVPREYNPEEGKTKRELFQQKMHKIINHDTLIDYCGVMVGKDGKKIPTFRGNPLDSVPIQTKEQFKIFRDFTYDNFIKDKLNIVWDDHAESKQESPLFNPYEVTKIIEKRNKIHTVNEKPYQESKIQKNKQTFKITQQTEPKLERARFHSESFKLPTLVQVPISKLRSKTKVQTGRMLCHDQNTEIHEKFKIIGGYNRSSLESESITKYSIIKYLKRFIYKPIRIIDFLEVKPVETLESYNLLVKRIKNMPKKHRDFMCFLFYDTNNDAVICQNDLSRLRNLTRNSNHLESDYQKLLKAKHSQKMEVPPEFDLYRLPQITESTFFNFLQKRPQGKHDLDFQKMITEQTYEGDSVLLTLKKRYRIDFERFQKCFRGEKPKLWYLLMDVLGGLRYEGVIYS